MYALVTALCAATLTAADRTRGLLVAPAALPESDMREALSGGPAQHDAGTWRVELQSELRRNMIHHMSTETSLQATLLRVAPVCQAAYVALKQGLVVADKLHLGHGWNPAADIHYFRHSTRRDAMETLKQVSTGAVSLDDDDNLGLAMSGLIIELPDDTIRIWHTTESHVPTPESESGRGYVTQSTGEPDLFEGAGVSYDAVTSARPRNRLIIQWTAQGLEILRFNLIRPTGYKKGKVECQWLYSLLPNYKSMPDVPFRRRDDDEQSGDVEGT